MKSHTDEKKQEGLESIRHLCPFHVSYTLRYETVEQHKKSHINLQLDRRPSIAQLAAHALTSSVRLSVHTASCCFSCRPAETITG